MRNRLKLDNLALAPSRPSSTLTSSERMESWTVIQVPCSRIGPKPFRLKAESPRVCRRLSNMKNQTFGSRKGAPRARGAKGSLPAVQVQLTKVLLLDFRVLAIFVQGCKTFIQQGFQLFVTFFDTHCGFSRQQRIVDWLADFVAGACWRLQEAQLGLQHILHRSVETAGGQVSINLVLVGVGLGGHTGLVQYGLGVGFLDGALLVAHGFALEGLRRGEVRTLFEHQGRRAGEQLAGEADGLLAGFGHGHRRNHTVEVTFDPFALDLQLGTDGVAQINVEADQATVCGLGFEWRVRRIDAEAQFLVFLGHSGAGGHAESQCRKGQQCFFHYLFPKNQYERLWRTEYCYWNAYDLIKVAISEPESRTSVLKGRNMAPSQLIMPEIGRLK